MSKTPRRNPPVGGIQAGRPRFFQHQSFEAIYRLLALPVLKFIVKKMGGDQEAAEEIFGRTISAAWEAGINSAINPAISPGFAGLP